jgi:hypothetical protein
MRFRHTEPAPYSYGLLVARVGFDAEVCRSRRRGVGGDLLDGGAVRETGLAKFGFRTGMPFGGLLSEGAQRGAEQLMLQPGSLLRVIIWLDGENGVAECSRAFRSGREEPLAREIDRRPLGQGAVERVERVPI